MMDHFLVPYLQKFTTIMEKKAYIIPAISDQCFCIIQLKFVSKLSWNIKCEFKDHPRSLDYSVLLQ